MDDVTATEPRTKENGVFGEEKVEEEESGRKILTAVEEAGNEWKSSSRHVGMLLLLRPLYNDDVCRYTETGWMESSYDNGQRPGPCASYHRRPLLRFSRTI